MDRITTLLVKRALLPNAKLQWYFVFTATSMESSNVVTILMKLAPALEMKTMQNLRVLSMKSVMKTLQALEGIGERRQVCFWPKVLTQRTFHHQRGFCHFENAVAEKLGKYFVATKTCAISKLFDIFFPAKLIDNNSL